MSTEENIQFAQKGYADFAKGDIASIIAVLDENIVWVSPDIGMPPGGTYHGKAGVTQFFQHVAEAWEFQAFEPRDFIASGDRVAVSGAYTCTSRATGRQVTAEWAMIWTIRDGKLVHFQEYTDSAALRDALTAAPTA